jgi:hypothetical protein
MVRRKLYARLSLYVSQGFCRCEDACSACCVWWDTSNPPWVCETPVHAAAPCSCNRQHSWSWSIFPALSTISLPSWRPVTPLLRHSPIAARQSTHTQWQQPSRTSTVLWRGTDTTFYQTLSHLINLNVQVCKLSWLPISFHCYDLLWLILRHWQHSTWLVSWLTTLSCYSDDCSLISDQSLCDLACCIWNKLTSLLHCLRLLYFINAGIS